MQMKIPPLYCLLFALFCVLRGICHDERAKKNA